MQLPCVIIREIIFLLYLVCLRLKFKPLNPEGRKLNFNLKQTKLSKNPGKNIIYSQGSCRLYFIPF